ncbi:uncharacterized protein [Hetaerina americana]|uniref:uncharacterized protein n=1 Tax=Hetaerina americana TaxID=62018 RepID=UPI003A7F5827
MKAAIRCHETEDWVDVLPAILLGLRSAWKEDLKSTAAELVYGEPLRLPGEFLSPPQDFSMGDQTSYVVQLKKHMARLSPQAVTRHGVRPTFVFKSLKSSSHVFVRVDRARGALQPPYEGPFEVLQRESKFYLLRIRGRERRVSIDRLKPAFIIACEIPHGAEGSPSPTLLSPTTATPVVAWRAPLANQAAPQTAPAPHAAPAPQAPIRPAEGRATRSGRRVRFPAHLRDFST